MGSTIVASKTSLEKAIRLAWLDDLNTFGEDSYVYNNDEKLKALFGMKEAINSGLAGQRVFAYGAEKGLHVGNALSMINGIGSANWSGLSTVDAVLGSTVAMGKVNANIRAKRLLDMMIPYTRIEYIESTGTQYIDTGYIQTSENMKIECEFNITTRVNGSSLFGAQAGTDSNLQFPMVVYTDTSTYDVYVGTSHKVMSMTMNPGTDYKLICEANNGTITTDLNGTQTNATYSGGLDKSLHMTIFGNNINGTLSPNLSAMKLKSFRIYDNGNLVRDFIPVLDRGGVACLYDMVTEKFFYNSGTGTFGFLQKSDSSILYTELEYIEATGTQYIDTGYVVKRSTSEYVFVMDADITNNAYAGANAYLQYQNDSSISLTPRMNLRMEYSCGNNTQTVYVNDAKVLTKDWSSYTGDNIKIGLFRLGDTNNAWYDGDNQIGKLYSFTLYDGLKGTNKIRDCVPAKDSNGVVCLYDKVHDEFLYNAGTGSFVGGPEVAAVEDPEKPAMVYTEVEYLQSGYNSAYFDTGYKPNSNTRVVLDSEAYTDTTEVQGYYFGTYTGDNNDYSMYYNYGSPESGYVSHYFGGNSDIYTEYYDYTYGYRFTIDKTPTKTTISSNSSGGEYIVGTYTTTANKESAVPMFIMAANSSNGAVAPKNMRFYSMQIYEGSTLIHDYIAAKDSDNTPCIYDKVTETALYNACTTDQFNKGDSVLIVGPEIA